MTLWRKNGHSASCPVGPLGTGYRPARLRVVEFGVNDFRAIRASLPRRCRQTSCGRGGRTVRRVRRHGRAGGARLAPRKRSPIVPIFGRRRLDA